MRGVAPTLSYDQNMGRSGGHRKRGPSRTASAPRDAERGRVEAEPQLDVSLRLRQHDLHHGWVDVALREFDDADAHAFLDTAESLAAASGTDLREAALDLKRLVSAAATLQWATDIRNDVLERIGEYVRTHPDADLDTVAHLTGLTRAELLSL